MLRMQHEINQLSNRSSNRNYILTSIANNDIYKRLKLSTDRYIDHLLSLYG